MIYLAAPWANRVATRAIRDELVAMGCEVTSRWLDVPDGPQVPDEARAIQEARMDIDDINAAEMLIVLTDERPIGAGHHVEFGYAMAIGLDLVVVGPIKSVFHYLAGYRFSDWPSAKAALFT